MTEPISNALSLCKSDSPAQPRYVSSDDEANYYSQYGPDPSYRSSSVRYFFTKTPTNFLPKGESGKIKKILCRTKPTG